MERLSTEVLQQTCGFLSRRDLFRFSLVNRKCWAASKPHTLRTVCVEFSSPETLEANVERWTDLLAASESFAAVQHLQIVAKHLCSMSQRLEDCGDRPLEPWKYCAIDGRDTGLLIEAQWHKLDELLGKLPALRNLTWGCAEQIPPCILRCLHECLPQCRLHMRNFSLRSLVQPPQDPLRISSHELELATSPCLYSIAMKYDYMYSDCANYNEHAVKDMMAGAAPNLQEVSLLYESSGSDPWLVAALRIPRQTWHGGLIPLPSADTVPGALKSLELATSITIDSLESWKMTTDFPVLRSLKLHCGISSVGLRWLADNCQFSLLDTLVISPSWSVNETLEELSDTTESFLLSLPPLRKLKITGTYQQRTVYLAMDHSGVTLRQLHLPLVDDYSGNAPKSDSPGFANPYFLHALQQKCPLLEDLSLCMLRSQGNAREVAIYRGLSEILTLRKIYLSIYCSQPLLWDEDILEAINGADDSMKLTEEDRASEIDNTLIDLAIDDTLARSVFHTISSARPTYATSLECFTLRVDGLESQGGFGSPFDLIRLLRYIGRSWVCTTTLRNDRPHECLVEEYDPEEKLDREHMEETNELAEMVNEELTSALHRVWPRSRQRIWKDEWHSFPLEAVKAQ